MTERLLLLHGDGKLRDLDDFFYRLGLGYRETACIEIVRLRFYMSCVRSEINSRSRFIFHAQAYMPNRHPSNLLFNFMHASCTQISRRYRISCNQILITPQGQILLIYSIEETFN